MSPRGGKDQGEAGADERRVFYCLIPDELAGKLHDPLRRHFRDDPSVEVVVERRAQDRRRSEGRRRVDGLFAEGAPVTEEEEGGEVPPEEAEDAPPEGADERRQIRAVAGRRIGERRARQVPIEPPGLPRAARRHSERIVFVERIEPATERKEDRDTARLVVAYQAGDRDAYGVIYKRYFERVYGYMRVLFRDHYEAEDATSEAFDQALEALPDYERREQPFRAWLFAIARNSAVARLRKLRRIEPTDPAKLDRRREEEGVQQGDELPVLDWITDRDLSLFVGRLPLPQRQVLVLRYLLDLDFAQISTLLNRTNEDVRQLQLRALRFLEERLRAVGRAPEQRTKPLPVTRKKQQSGVLRLRRFMLE
jgi:RNA polymerase sigma-70 factor (ECF subfamily)